jgi:adenosylcobinamide-phosphate synthase
MIPDFVSFAHFFSNILNNVASPERLNAAMIAVVAVCVFGALFGSFTGNANPFLWGILDRVFGGFTKKTYKIGRSISSLYFRGALILSLYILLTGCITACVVLIEKQFSLAGFMEPILLTCVLAGGATWSALIKLHKAIRAEEGKTLSKGSYYDIAVSTRTNLNTTDNHGIIRGGIGFVATSIDKGMVAPLFWYLIGGLPFAFMYAGIAAARWGMGKEGFAKGIGHLALKLEEILGFIPQLITVVILSFAALMTPSARLTRAVMGVFAKSGRAPYAEGGLPLTILAYALDVSLGGPVEDSDGSVLKRAWVGSKTSTAKVEIHHLRVAIYLSIMAHILTFSVLLAGVVAWKLSVY